MELTTEMEDLSQSQGRCGELSGRVLVGLQKTCWGLTERILDCPDGTYALSSKTMRSNE